MDYLKTNITFIDNAQKLPALSDFFKRKKEFVWDLETNVTDDVFERRIRTMAFGDMEEQYVVDLLGFSSDLTATQGNFTCHEDYAAMDAVVAPVLDSNEWLKIGYFIEFEYVTTRWCLGWWPWNLFCCLNAEKTIQCGRVNFKIKGFWGLDDALKRYFGVELSKDLQKSFDLVTPLTEEQIKYAAMDVSIPKLLKDTQLEKINELGLYPTVVIENNVTPAFGEQHLNGIKLDTVEWGKRIEELKIKKALLLAALDEHFLPIVGLKELPEVNLEKLEQEWRDTVPDKTFRKGLDKAQKAAYDDEIRTARAAKLAIYREKSKFVNEMTRHISECEGAALINYNSPKQLIAALLKLGVPTEELPNTNSDTLIKIAGKYPVIKTLNEFRGVKKLEGTYGQPFLDHINKVTGRIHSRLHQIGAETGRASSTKPNIFNLPQGEEWRRGFVAELGNKVITTDFSGQELRILTEVSKEPVWVKAFRAGWDVHSVVAELIFGEQWARGAVKDGKCNNIEVFYEKGERKGQPIDDCAYFFKNKQKCDCPVHKKLRNDVKSINFGIAYGMTENKLSVELGITRGEARALLEKYYAAVRVLIQYLTKSGNYAKVNLKSRTIGGRLRYFRKPLWDYARKLLVDDGVERPTQEEISRKMWSLSASIEREGKNTVIQGCIVFNTRVFDKHLGYQKVGDLVGKSVEVWDGTQFSKAVVVYSGKKQLVELSLFGGYYIECSPLHKFSVIDCNGRSYWKSVNEIKKLDRVILGDPVPVWNLPLEIGKTVKPSAHNAHDYNLEKVIETANLFEFGRWLGRIASDGGITLSKGTITLLVAEHEKELLPILEEFTNNIGLCHSVSKTVKRRTNGDKYKPVYRINICYTGLARQLYNFGLKKIIPDFVWKNTELLRGYVSGLFDGDGTVNESSISLTFGKQEYKLAWARQVQQALLLLGIRSRVNHYPDIRTNVVVLKRDCHLFSRQVGFLNSKKQAKALKIKDNRNYKNKIYGNGFRVKSLKVTDKYVDMYDVVNSQTEKFMANGMVVHNSGADMLKLSLGCGFDDQGKPYLWHVLRERKAKLINNVYDEVVVECAEDIVNELAPIISERMCTAAATFVKIIPFETEQHIENHWQK